MKCVLRNAFFLITTAFSQTYRFVLRSVALFIFIIKIPMIIVLGTFCLLILLIVYFIGYILIFSKQKKELKQVLLSLYRLIYKVNTTIQHYDEYATSIVSITMQELIEVEKKRK